MPSAWDLLPEDLRALGYRRDVDHLFGRIQRPGRWRAGETAEPRPSLPRDAFDLALDLSIPRVVDEVASTDGSTRLVLELVDGARIEAVHMPRAVKNPRVTVCLSSQVGCAMGCTFCATARMGLVRNLTASEIVGQLLAVLLRHGPITSTAQSVSLVFMGMGEPLHNVEAVIRALEVVTHPSGLGLAPSRITVSTAGHVAGLDRLARARVLPELAISVNGATTAIRRSLMPVDRRWPLTELRAALERWPRRPHQKLTLEYVLLDGVNDDMASADALAAWAAGLRHVINVIPFNPWETGDTGERAYREPPASAVLAFVARLREHGCLVTVRRSRGRDVRAACGTLAIADVA